MTDERLVRFCDVPKLPWLPRQSNGKRLNVATVYRWAQRGLRGIKLHYEQVGGVRCTTESALHRFFEQLRNRDKTPSFTPTARRREEIKRSGDEVQAILSGTGATSQDVDVHRLT